MMIACVERERVVSTKRYFGALLTSWFVVSRVSCNITYPLYIKDINDAIIASDAFASRPRTSDRIYSRGPACEKVMAHCEIPFDREGKDARACMRAREVHETA